MKKIVKQRIILFEKTNILTLQGPRGPRGPKSPNFLRSETLNSAIFGDSYSAATHCIFHKYFACG